MVELERGEQSEGVVMTVHDVARYLRLSESKVYQMTRRGAVPAVRMGKTWRFRKDILDEWMRRESEKSPCFSGSPSVHAEECPPEKAMDPGRP